MAAALSVAVYIRSLGFNTFRWQQDVLESTSKRTIINGARQSGKSTVVTGIPAWTGRFVPRSLSIIGAATEKQAFEDMEKVKDFIARDPAYPAIVRDSDSLIELDNGSRILVVPATEKAARGYSNPDVMILDEASRIGQAVYRSGFRPMLTDNPKCKLILISTPHGREGFFYRAWTTKGTRWEKFEVRSPWDVVDEEWLLAPAIAEAKYRAERARELIKAYYSPRHRDRDEQQEMLEDMTPRLYRQEECCEFVESEDQVYNYADIQAMFSEEVKGMTFGLQRTDDVKALEVQR